MADIVRFKLTNLNEFVSKIISCSKQSKSIIMIFLKDALVLLNDNISYRFESHFFDNYFVSTNAYYTKITVVTIDYIFRRMSINSSIIVTITRQNSSYDAMTIKRISPGNGIEWLKAFLSNTFTETELSSINETIIKESKPLGIVETINDNKRIYDYKFTSIARCVDEIKRITGITTVITGTIDLQKINDGKYLYFDNNKAVAHEKHSLNNTIIATYDICEMFKCDV